MKYTMLGIALLSLSAGAHAGGAVEQARADCAANKMKVRALEARMAPDRELSAARKTWEASCVRAQQVITGAADAPPASPVLVAPAPTVTIVTPAASAPAAQCVPAAPAPPEAPAMPAAPPAS